MSLCSNSTVLSLFLQIRDETNTRIDLPGEHAESDVITITGKKADVELARNKIEDIQKDLVRACANRNRDDF